MTPERKAEIQRVNASLAAKLAGGSADQRWFPPPEHYGRERELTPEELSRLRAHRAKNNAANRERRRQLRRRRRAETE